MTANNKRQKTLDNLYLQLDIQARSIRMTRVQREEAREIMKISLFLFSTVFANEIQNSGRPKEANRVSSSSARCYHRAAEGRNPCCTFRGDCEHIYGCNLDWLEGGIPCKNQWPNCYCDESCLWYGSKLTI